MKKIGFLALISLLGIFACGNGNGKETSSTKEEKSPSEEKSTPAKVIEENKLTSEVQTSNSEKSGTIIHLTKQMFIDDIMDYETNPNEWIYKDDMPGLIDFYADWCRPCKITSPIIDELAKEYSGKLKVYKVNVDSERELSSIFGIQSIPSFLFMPVEGKPTMSSGIAQTPEETKEMFIQQIEELLLK